jgi:hypothetical protein
VKQDVLELLQEKQKRVETNRISFYKAYPYQKKFHAQGKDCPQRILMAANRVGKTYCGAVETAYHLTGEYPDWWEGRRFKKPVKVWAAGESNDTTRDIIQKELFGSPHLVHLKTLHNWAKVQSPWTRLYQQCVSRVYLTLSVVH